MANKAKKHLLLSSPNNPSAKEVAKKLADYLYLTHQEATYILQLNIRPNFPLPYKQDEFPPGESYLEICKPKIHYHRCILCAKCLHACQYEAIHLDRFNHRAIINYDFCTGCGSCIQICPKEALENTCCTIGSLHTSTHQHITTITASCHPEYAYTHAIVKTLEKNLPSEATHILYNLFPTDDELIEELLPLAQTTFLLASSAEEMDKLIEQLPPLTKAKHLFSKHISHFHKKYFVLDKDLSLQQLFS